MGVGKNIEDLAELRGLSLRQVAIKSEIPYNTLYSIVKRDSKRISRETLDTVSKALGVTSMELYNYSDSSGGSIRFARLKAGMTYKQLAEKIGEPVEQIVQYESNEKKLSIDAVRSFAKALDASPALIMGCRRINEDGEEIIDIYGPAWEIAEMMDVSPLVVEAITSELDIYADTIEEFDKIVEEVNRKKVILQFEKETLKDYLDSISAGMRKLNDAGQSHVASFAVSLANDLAKIPEYQRSPNKKITPQAEAQGVDPVSDLDTDS